MASVSSELLWLFSTCVGATRVGVGSWTIVENVVGNEAKLGWLDGGVGVVVKVTSEEVALMGIPDPMNEKRKRRERVGECIVVWRRKKKDKEGNYGVFIPPRNNCFLPLLWKAVHAVFFLRNASFLLVD